MSYATVDEFKELSLGFRGYEGATDEQIQGFLTLSAGVIDTYIGDRYTLPITGENNFLKRCNLDLATCDLLLWRGYNPQDGDEQYAARCDKWMSILEDIRKGNLGIPGLDPINGTGIAQVSTKTRRGYLGSCEPDKVGGML